MKLNKKEFRKFLTDFEKNIADCDIKIRANETVLTNQKSLKEIIIEVRWVGNYVSSDYPHLTKQWQQKVTSRLRKMGFWYDKKDLTYHKAVMNCKFSY